MTTHNRVNIVATRVEFDYPIYLIEIIGIANSRYISRKILGWKALLINRGL